MIPGGISDKLGNGYEAYWTLSQVLRVVQGLADSIRLEPFNEDAGGFEFKLLEGKTTQWHQCKRLSSGSWTISALDRRGVLADFARKLQAEGTECVFVTSAPVAPFDSLTAKAKLVAEYSAFLSSLNENDEKGFHALQEIWKISNVATFNYLRRCKVEVGSDGAQRNRVEEHCGLLFQGGPQKIVPVLKSFVEDSLTQTLTTEGLRKTLLEEQQLQWRGTLDPTIDSLIEEATDAYLRSLRTTIAGVTLENSATPSALEALKDETKTRVVISGQAGSGKSATFFALIQEARALSWPVLAFRIDRFLSCNSMSELGDAILGKPENPVSVVGNRFGRTPTLLVIDQIDAVSESSGRSSRARDLLFQLLQSAQHFPALKVVLACRTYDLENDHHFSHLSNAQTTQLIKVPPLEWETSVVQIINKLGLAAQNFSERAKRILSLPINLSLFSEVVASGESVPAELSTGRLIALLLKIREREGSEAGVQWSPTVALGAMAASMSRNQELSAPVSVLSPYLNAITLLSSYGLITHDHAKVQFIHESFFDHIFAESFLASGSAVIELLKSDEQRLFRRTQVRQIFTRLREVSGERQYFRELSAVMTSDEVRYLVKDAIGAWLTTVEHPTANEVQLVLSWFQPEHPLQNLARPILHNPGWFSSLVDRGLFEVWLNGSEEHREFGMWVLRSNVETHPNLVAKILRKIWQDDAQRTPEIMRWFAVLYADGPIADLETLYTDIIKVSPASLFEGATATTRLDLGTWTHAGPALGARMLGVWLDRWFEVFSSGQPFERHHHDNDNHWLNEIVNKAPKVFLDAVMPSFALALQRDMELVNGPEPYYSAFSNLRNDDLPDDYPDLIRKALQTVAATEPSHADALLDLLPTEARMSVHLQLETIAANGALAPRLVKLLSHSQLLKAGFYGAEWSSFAAAARTSIPFLNRTERVEIERIAIDYRPEERFIKKHLMEDLDGNRVKFSPETRQYAIRHLARTGRDSRAILRTIGPDLLSDDAQRRLAELDRKFPGEPLPEPMGIRGGWVQSPIPAEAAAKMSDKQWLKAMARYKDDSDRVFMRGHAHGGSDALSSVLREQTKTDPTRYAKLLKKIPLTANSDYPEAIVMGLHGIKTVNASTALETIRIAWRWPGREMDRMICWLLQSHPSLSSEPDILAFVFSCAVDGTASDDSVKITSNQKEGRTPSVNEILSHASDCEHSSINSLRGNAYDVLGRMLWHDETLYNQVLDFTKIRIAAEPLRSVRMQMIDVINAISKYDHIAGIGLLYDLAAKDIHALACRNGFHILSWATYNYPDLLKPMLDRMMANDSEQLQAMGIFLLSGVALGDAEAEEELLAMASQSLLARRITAYRASGNIGSDKFGERANEWVKSLFNDRERLVRDEASRCNWESLLAASSNNQNLAYEFVASEAFVDHPGRFTHTLGKLVDVYPDLTMKTVERIVALLDHWRQVVKRDLYTVTHDLGRVMVNLYRNLEANPPQEKKVLDLIDAYLARNLYEIRKALADYERH